MLERQLGSDPAARAALTQAKREIALSLDELRDVARGLHPAGLSGHGLPVALESLAARAAVPVRLTVRLTAVRRVARGGSAIDPSIVSTLLSKRRVDDPLGRLTPRERQVLELMASGHSNQGIRRPARHHAAGGGEVRVDDLRQTGHPDRQQPVPAGPRRPRVPAVLIPVTFARRRASCKWTVILGGDE